MQKSKPLLQYIRLTTDPRYSNGWDAESGVADNLRKSCQHPVSTSAFLYGSGHLVRAKSRNSATTKKSQESIDICPLWCISSVTAPKLINSASPYTTWYVSGRRKQEKRPRELETLARLAIHCHCQGELSLIRVLEPPENQFIRLRPIQMLRNQ